MVESAIETPSADTLKFVRELAQNPFDPRLLIDSTAIGRQLVETALVEGTTRRSLLHAHIPGLHSITLFDREQTGGGKIRLFYTEAGEHQLTKMYDKDHDFNLRPHDHHFPIAIVPLVGNLLHIRTEESPRPTNYVLNKFIFKTAVGNDNFGLTPCGEQALQLPDQDMLVPGDVELLDSLDIHSVTNFELGKQSTTAWIVIEGPKEDKDSLLFSRFTRPPMDADGLYVPAGRADVERVLTDTLDKMQRG